MILRGVERQYLSAITTPPARPCGWENANTTLANPSKQLLLYPEFTINGSSMRCGE